MTNEGQPFEITEIRCAEAVREATLLRVHVVTALSFFESVPLGEPFSSEGSDRLGERLVEHVRNITKKVP